jgi:predicted ribosomally synthesized peptide with SipW-like signal peptide
MKKIIGLTIAALLIIGIVGVGTFAYFSDTAASNGNTWTAGTLVLSEVTAGSATHNSFVVTPGGGINGSVQFGLTDPVVPQSSGTITWTLNNTGNVAGTLTMVVATTFGQGGAPNAPETAAETALGGVKGLDTGITIWVTRNGTPILGTSGTPVPMSDVAILTTGLNIERQSLVTAAPLVYVLNWQVLASVGNEIQGDTAQLDISFTLNQTP